VRDFHHAQLVGTPAQVEEAEVAHQAAAHHLVGRHGGVETAGHQHQGLLQGAQRVTADAVVLAVDHEQPLVANFDAHFQAFQVDPGGAALRRSWLPTYFSTSIELNGCLPARLQRTEKILPASSPKCCLHFSTMSSKSPSGYSRLQEVRDARHAAQALDHLLQGFGSLTRVSSSRLSHTPFTTAGSRSRSTARMFLAWRMKRVPVGS
jgi:hypothetical protein